MAGAEENPTSGASRPTGWDRLIYLPYKNLRDVFNRESGTAFMPYEQFLRLWERIGASGDSGSAKPPVSAAVTKARYVARVEKDIARIDATLTVQVLGSGWVELPIRFGAAAIGKFTASDTQALLVGTGNGAYALLLPKSGEFTIQLELTARVHSSPDGRGFEFDCPPTGITTFELTVPAADQTVEITPQLVALPVEGDGKTTRVTAQLGATRKIAARWHPRVSTAPVMEVLTTVQNVTDVRIADGLVHTQAVLNFQVLRGQVDQLQVAVPLGHNILDVTTPGIKSWKATKEEKRQVLTVELLGTESKTIPLEVRTEYPLPAEAFSPAGIDDEETVHGIHALGEFRESGLLAISAASDLSLTVEQQSGLIRAEAVEAPEALRRPDAIFYKFYSPRIRLQLAVKAVEPRILVEQQARLVFAEDELQLSSRLQYTVERAGVFELRLNVPEGVSISRVDCEQMKEFRTIDDGRVLVVTLKEKTKGQIAAMVSGQIGRDALPDEGAPIPLLEPVGPSGADVARETGTILIYAPESLEVITDVPAVQSAQPARIDPATVEQVPNARLASAWTFNRRPVSIPVRTKRRDTRLTVATATTVTLRQDIAEVVTLLNYRIAYAGMDTFRFAVPESVAGRTQVELAGGAGATIKQQSKAEMPEDGWVVWTVILQRELTGDLALRVRYDTLPAAGEKGASKLVVSPVRVLDVPSPVEGQPAIVPAAVAGEIAVQKDRALSVAARADAFETIDVRELTMLPADGYLAFRYFKQPAELTDALSLELTYSRQEIQGVVQTVISHALVEAVVTDDKVVTYRGRYRLKTSERQRLAVDLPKDAEILETSVAGRRVDLEKNDDAPSSQQWNSYYVNVARQTAADEPFVLAVVFRSPYRDRPLRGREGLLALVFPRIGRPAEGAETSVALQELRTVVWVPEDYNLVGTPRGFVRERRTFIDPILGAIAYATTSADHEAWFGDNSAGMFAFKSSGRAYAYRKLGSTDTLEVAYWQTDWFTWLISGAILAIAVVLAATSWENRLTIVLLGAFGAAMYALYDADLVINALAAARFGLIAMFALWFIRALRRPPSPPAPKSPDTSPPAATGTELPTEPATPSNSPGNEPQSSDTPTVS
jgi:hypothetical protein